MTVVGDRVELVSCSDPYTRLRPGEVGTVRLVDSLGTIHVEWDSGSRLGLVPGEDAWRTLPALVTCPDCGTARSIGPTSDCAGCGLRWEDVEAAADFAQRHDLLS